MLSKPVRVLRRRRVLLDRGLLCSARHRFGLALGDGHRRRSSYPGHMHPGVQDLAGWAELRAWRDDDRLGAHIRLLLNAYERDDRSAVRAQAMRLLVDVPPEWLPKRSRSVTTADVAVKVYAPNATIGNRRRRA